MKSFVLTNKNRTELQLVDKPSLKGHQALVKIQAAALNHRDEWIRIGQYANIKFPSILGSDGCGMVVEISSQDSSQNELWDSKSVIINPSLFWGEKEEHQSEEYEVLGMPTSGTFAEYIAVPIENLVEKPHHLTAEQAAALPLAGLTAYRATITKGKITSGMQVLVTGVGGGVALMATQIALATGANVWVSSGDNYKLEHAMDIGVTGGVNYKQQDWNKDLRKKAGLFDVIIDSAGGDQINTLIKLLKPGGILVFYGATLGRPTWLDVHRIFWNQLRIEGSTMGSPQEFRAMVDFVNSHKIVPVVDSVRPFDDISTAFERMQEGKQFGKLVVSMKK
jgi:NADPH:quinone reductase-like Zn-dependent oxidoreductase